MAKYLAEVATKAEALVITERPNVSLVKEDGSIIYQKKQA